jgi:MICOS complex subunit MIC26
LLRKTRTADRIKSFASPTETLTPGLLFVGVATLSSSIITRNRMLASRFLVPPTLFIVTMHQFLPETTSNISAYLNSLEEQHFPNVAEKHRVGRAHASMTVDRVKDWTQQSRERFDSGVERLIDWLQKSTGLRLREGLGRGVKPAELAVQETK